MKFYITGTRRGLGEALKQKYDTVSTLEECDIFINCKHDGFEQVDMLYKAAALNKRIINIGSHASDFTYLHKYAVEKRALREANNQLFIAGKKTTCLNFGYFDTERSAHKDVEKMPLDYVIDVIEWVLIQEYNVKELTVCA
jgi:hypothetical protein|tara:strand:+ start:335 stop:757 length:423 start_codon:yes stop_codon:yes gene_type:complete